MHDPSIPRVHRVEGDRATCLLGLVRQAKGERGQVFPPPLTISLDVDRHAPAVAVLVPPGNPIDEILQRIQSLAAATDQQTSTVAGNVEHEDTRFVTGAYADG